VEPDIAASLDNASNRVQEAGVARFDVVQQQDDPTRFVLLEVYHDAAAQIAHRQTAHYARWRDAVVDWMAEPRTLVKLTNLFPGDEGW
jgi:quinol monooxygenase YgiN